MNGEQPRLLSLRRGGQIIVLSNKNFPVLQVWGIPLRNTKFYDTVTCYMKQKEEWTFGENDVNAPRGESGVIILIY